MEVLAIIHINLLQLFSLISLWLVIIAARDSHSNYLVSFLDKELSKPKGLLTPSHVTHSDCEIEGDQTYEKRHRRTRNLWVNSWPDRCWLLS